MAHCVNLLAYCAIILLHVIFIGGAGGMVYFATRNNRKGSTGLYIGAGIMILFVLLFDLMIWCYRTQFKMALAIIAAAADFASETKRLIFV